MLADLRLGSVVWWLLVQASPSRRPSNCSGQLPPKPCLFRRTVVSHPEQLAARVSTKWPCMSYFQWKNFCYRSATPQPYPVRRLSAQLWHQCTDGVFVWAPTQPICDKDLTVLRFEPGSPSWDTGTLTNTARAHAHIHTHAPFTEKVFNGAQIVLIAKKVWLSMQKYAKS